MVALSQDSRRTGPPGRTQRSGAGGSPSLVLAIVSAGVVLASIDLFIVNVALPQIGRQFGRHGGGLGDLSWVLNAYAIVYAAFLVLFGRLAERYRRDHWFLLGVALFVAASAACGAASGLWMLVAFRIVQAAGAALLTPTSLGLVLASFPAERRQGAVRTWTAIGGMSATLGPVLGGLLVAASWRWVFLVNVPIGLLALALGRRFLPPVPGQRVAAPAPGGALLVTGGVGALVLGLVNGGAWGWGNARTVVVVGIGVLLLGVFAANCARSRNPLIDPSLFGLRPFTGAAVVALFFSAAFGAMLLSRVLWAQHVWHWSPLLTGVSIAPGPLMVPLVSFLLTGRLTAKLGAGVVIAAGCATFALGAAWWALVVGLRPDYAGEVLGGMLLTGIGVGLALPAIMASGTASLPAHSLSTGSAVVNMFRQIGLALGVAILVAILGAPHSPLATLDVYRRAWFVVAAISLLAAILGAWLLSARRTSATAAAATAPSATTSPACDAG